MKQKTLFALWGGLYIVCAGLGFIPERSAMLQGILTALAVAFFIPGVLLLRRGTLERDASCLKLLRNLALLSLMLTLVLLVGSFLTVLGSIWLGDVIYNMLVIVSAPMLCSGYWALSLFLWAALLMGSLAALRKIKKEGAR